MAFIYVRSDSPEYGEMAALLVAMADEAGIHTRELLTTPHGFDVPDVLSNQLIPGAWAPLDPKAEGKTPPPGWDEPLPEVNVEQHEDGKFYLKAEATLADDGAPISDELTERFTEAMMAPIVEDAPAAAPSDIRSWAIENGLAVPKRGKLPQSVIDAYFEAFPG
jgi:hypothetical protein